MAVQDSEAPCRKDKQCRSGKKDLYQPDGEESRFTMEAGHDHVDQPGGSEDACQRQKRRDQKKDGEDCFGQLVGLLVSLFRPQAGVHGDKRSGKDALAEERLQEVGNAESAAKCIRRVGVAEVVRKHTFTQQPDDFAQQNAGTYSKCGGA